MKNDWYVNDIKIKKHTRYAKSVSDIYILKYVQNKTVSFYVL